MTQGRAQLQTIKIGGSRDGRILAYRIDIIQDTGAYPRIGGFLPFLTCLMAPGVYDIPRAGRVPGGGDQRHADRAPTAAPGGPRPRPPSSARSTCSPPRSAWTRPRSGGATSSRRTSSPSRPRPAHCTTAATTPSRWTRSWPRRAMTDLREEQERRRAGGDARQLGIGVSTYVEITAADAAARGDRQARGGPTTARATVYTGSSAHGQGHAHRLGDARAGRARHPDGPGHGHPRRHRPDPGRRRHLRLPRRCSSAARRCTRPRSRSRTRPGARPRTCSRPPKPTWCSTPTRAWQVRGDPDTALSGARSPAHTERRRSSPT